MNLNEALEVLLQDCTGLCRKAILIEGPKPRNLNTTLRADVSFRLRSYNIPLDSIPIYPPLQCKCNSALPSTLNPKQPNYPKLKPGIWKHPAHSAAKSRPKPSGTQPAPRLCRPMAPKGWKFHNFSKLWVPVRRTL